MYNSMVFTRFETTGVIREPVLDGLIFIWKVKKTFFKCTLNVAIYNGCELKEVLKNCKPEWYAGYVRQLKEKRDEYSKQSLEYSLYEVTRKQFLGINEIMYRYSSYRQPVYDGCE